MAIFVSVVLVLALLILFFLFVIRGIAIRLGKFAQLNVLRQSGVLDELIFSKQQELEILQARIDRAQQTSPGQYTPAAQGERSAQPYYAPPTAAYSEGGFVEEYHTIRDHFLVDRADHLQKILDGIASSSLAAAAEEILRQLNLDTLYLLSTLPSEQQKSILREAFNAPQNALLDDYIAQAGQLESYEFLAWLKDYHFRHREQVVVRTNCLGELYGRIDKRIQPVYDPSICEGVCIVAQGQVHDFSIRSREISG